ncbi:MAG: efflux RND transporter periplasmic adaptor subunit [Patescibacteria group bacterium]
MIKKHWKITTILLLLVVGGMWYVISKNTTAKITYQTAKIEKGTLVSSISASGNVLTTNTLSISTEASGVVKKVYVKDGDKVYAGQKLAEITLDSAGTLASTKAWASLTSAQNSYRSSQASLANTYDQIKGHESDETFAQKETRTKAEVSNDNAWANLVTANLTYKQTSPIITAPFSGIIGSVNLVEGMVLTSANSTTSINSQRVAVIKGGSLPVVSVSLSEVDVPKVKVGQKVIVTLDSVSGKTFTGKVATVDRVGSTSNNVTSYPANIKLDSSSDAILPNMAATANIILNTLTDVLIAPVTSIEMQNGINYAKVLKNGKQELVEVTLGLSTDDDVEIKSGVTEGQEVVIRTSTGSSKTTVTSTKSVFSSIGGGGFPR